MDQPKVDVVHSQIFERFFESRHRLFIAHVVGPEFGGDEQLFPVYAAPLYPQPDPFAHGSLVAIGGGRVYKAKTDTYRLRHAFRGDLSAEHTGAEAYHGHFDPVIECDPGYRGLFFGPGTSLHGIRHQNNRGERKDHFYFTAHCKRLF